MATRDRRVDCGTRRARQITRELGEEVHRARLQCGLSQRALADAVGLGQADVSVIERGLRLHVSVYHLARLLAVVGLEFSARAYATGSPIRDAAHSRLLARLVASSPPTLHWRFEVPIPIPGDRRAWDAAVALGGAQVAVEAETRPRDLQELQRRIALKRRDDPAVSHVILLLADTRWNRELVANSRDTLKAEFPLEGTRMRAALREGHDPGASGWLLG